MRNLHSTWCVTLALGCTIVLLSPRTALCQQQGQVKEQHIPPQMQQDQTYERQMQQLQQMQHKHMHERQIEQHTQKEQLQEQLLYLKKVHAAYGLFEDLPIPKSPKGVKDGTIVVSSPYPKGFIAGTLPGTIPQPIGKVPSSESLISGLSNDEMLEKIVDYIVSHSEGDKNRSKIRASYLKKEKSRLENEYGASIYVNNDRRKQIIKIYRAQMISDYKIM
ncbi:hypothetical protein [Hymenobacter sublimis]|uniref:Uncharacterized protein n=1 Tax=Hymenobacter sublimis TaxID=2933777 RepID=A0ABY4JF78_9BACT|nr:hypothetical protein [Hymenobacter sublimis]UPL50547.1 hypothetical protein MWH26_06470 [Hymenobacter sublimis]